jgi:hypothetical protein
VKLTARPALPIHELPGSKSVRGQLYESSLYFKFLIAEVGRPSSASVQKVEHHADQGS